MSGRLALRFAARSDVGLLRSGNEDSSYAGPRLLAVADGMGGHAAGEVASAVAIAALAPLDDDAPGADLTAALQRSAQSANDHLRDMVHGDSALDGMGTTLTALLFNGARLGVLHIGDSRCYLLRDGALDLITHDDTLVQSLVDEGRISEEEASTHPQRSLITRALDGRHGVDFDLSVREARLGDRYLLCTDGLTGPVGRLETLREALEIPDPQEAVDRLVALALRGGGPDNVTVVVADVVEDATGDGVPVIVGAAASSPQAPPPGVRDGAAARAHAARVRSEPVIARPTKDVAPTASRARGRQLLVGLGVLLLLALGAGAGYAYVQSQWYVGVDGERVAIYRGVTGSLAGVEFSGLDERTDLLVADLSALEQDRVRGGEPLEDRAAAQAYVDRLRAQVQTRAPDATPAPPPTPAPATPAVPVPVPVPVPAGPSPSAP